MPLAGELFRDSRPAALAHCARPLRVAQQLDHSLGHVLVVACGNDVTSFAFDYCFARAPDGRYDDGSRGGHVFENRV